MLVLELIIVSSYYQLSLSLGSNLPAYIIPSSPVTYNPGNLLLKLGAKNLIRAIAFKVLGFVKIILMLRKLSAYFLDYFSYRNLVAI